MNEHNYHQEAFIGVVKGLEENLQRLDNYSREFARTHHADSDPFNLSEIYSEWFRAAMANPDKVIEASQQYWLDSMKLYQQSLLSFWGINNENVDVISPQKSDRRFRHEAWVEQPVFSAIKQSYLLASRWARDSISQTKGMDKKTADKIAFFTERGLDSLSPTNFALTNPAVIDKTVETKGQNLIDGLCNMMADLEDGNGNLKIKTTDATAFELGVNIATTAGKVVAEHQLFQLIQFEPTTKTVFEKPLLIIPPWINKYYILDLQPKNSMIKWLTDQGHTVFVISWVNPDASYAQTGFDDYMKAGVIRALDIVEDISQSSSINAIGYCIGGTLLATTLAYLKELGDERVNCATFFTTMLDFSEPGELGVFIDEQQLASIEERMNETGFLEGESMASSFNLLRANDLIWSFYINNYLMGSAPRPFDLLYWNSDSTRMPAKMHSWYLRQLYVENNLIKGAVKMGEVCIDLSTIDTPSCFVSTEEDHIAPWLSTFSGARAFNGPVSFILGGSGHIAGIINPPEVQKYQYRYCNTLPEDPLKWANATEAISGSWWPKWQEWIQPQAGKRVPARAPGTIEYPVIEEAPGSYVKKRPETVSEETPQSDSLN